MTRMPNIICGSINDNVYDLAKKIIDHEIDSIPIVEKNIDSDLKEQYKNRVIIGGIYCVKCSDTDNRWTRATTDMQGSKNRFAFSVSTNSCPEPCMIEAWKQFGSTTFSFEQHCSASSLSPL